MAQLSIDTIESALADRGLDTQYTGMEHGTSYTITGGSKVIEIIDGVSGDYFRSDDVLEAIVYGDSQRDLTDATRTFDSVETVEEFLKAVAEIFA
jgi:hypothetical protein